MAFSLRGIVHAVRRALVELFGSVADPSPVQLSDRARLHALEESFETLRNEWRVQRRELAAELESMQDLAADLERKRARVAARKSRLDRKDNGEDEQPAIDPDSDEGLRLRARAAGLWHDD